MIYQLKNVLNAEQLMHCQQLVANGEFEDGKLTAGWHAKGVKRNLQWRGDEKTADALTQLLAHGLTNHAEFTQVTYPKYLAPFMVSESRDGGHYGPHIDDALMGQEQITRTDISCTIFLSPPESYEGGELVMDFSGVQMQFKLNAGDAIVYPSTTLHHVAPVTSGVRRVAVSWMESYIRDASKREMLHDLDVARQHVMSQSGKCDAFDRITKTHANLLRQWAET